MGCKAVLCAVPAYCNVDSVHVSVLLAAELPSLGMDIVKNLGQRCIYITIKKLFQSNLVSVNHLFGMFLSPFKKALLKDCNTEHEKKSPL